MEVLLIDLCTIWHERAKYEDLCFEGFEAPTQIRTVFEGGAWTKAKLLDRLRKHKVFSASRPGLIAGEEIRTLERTNRPGPEPGTFDHSVTPAEEPLLRFFLILYSATNLIPIILPFSQTQSAALYILSYLEEHSYSPQHRNTPNSYVRLVFRA